jgi:hypothetical protein
MRQVTSFGQALEIPPAGVLMNFEAPALCFRYPTGVVSLCPFWEHNYRVDAEFISQTLRDGYKRYAIPTLGELICMQ